MFSHRKKVPPKWRIWRSWERLMVLFAEDTNLFSSHHDLSNLTNLINIELLKLPEWFKANKLSLNIKKSNYIIFRPQQKRQITSLPLYINDHELHRTDHVVFLEWSWMNTCLGHFTFRILLAKFLDRLVSYIEQVFASPS